MLARRRMVLCLSRWEVVIRRKNRTLLAKLVSESVSPPAIVIWCSLTIRYLGRELCQSTASCGTFVIYMVNAFNEPTAIARLCEAFLKLLDAYTGSLGKENNGDTIDVVLQIMPLSLIASTETLTIPSPTVYKKIAFEVYDKCAPNAELDRTALTPFSGASAVQLAKVIPRSINLKLTCRSIDGSLVSDRCIHVSYCISTSSQWLTASWTDSIGHLQWNASYYLAADAEEVWPQFSEAAQDMWQTTLDIARALGAPYRFFIARVGPMPREEYDGTLRRFSLCGRPLTLSSMAIVVEPISKPSSAHATQNREAPAAALSKAYFGHNAGYEPLSDAYSDHVLADPIRSRVHPFSDCRIPIDAGKCFVRE